MDRGGVPRGRRQSPKAFRLQFKICCCLYYSNQSVPKAPQGMVTASQLLMAPVRDLQRSAIPHLPTGKRAHHTTCAERCSARGPFSGVPVVSARVGTVALGYAWLQSPSTWEVAEALCPGGKGFRRYLSICTVDKVRAECGCPLHVRNKSGR